MNATTTAANEGERGWRGELALRFSHDGARTVLSSRKHLGPLIVQRALYPENDVCHVYVVHPPGGIVGGDQLHFNAVLEEGAHALITTPAATKFYRSSMRAASLEQDLRLQRATLEWLPQETIIFRDAHARNSTRVHLDGHSHFIGWELVCYGRPASGELFVSGRIAQHFELWREDRPLLIDRLNIDGAAAGMNASWGLAANTLLGTLLAYPACADDLEAVRAHCDVASTIVDDVLICRCAGRDNDALKKIMIDMWRTLRPRLLGRDAVPPRIWAT